MADVFIEDFRSYDEIIAIATRLLHLVVQGEAEHLIEPGRFWVRRVDGQSGRPSDADLWDMLATDEYECLNSDHSDYCRCLAEAAQTDPRQLRVIDPAPAPLWYIPCPQRGEHATLTECWMCWCDVERDALIPAQALAPRELDT